VFLAVAAQEKHLGERFELSVHRPHPKDCDWVGLRCYLLYIPSCSLCEAQSYAHTSWAAQATYPVFVSSRDLGMTEPLLMGSGAGRWQAVRYGQEKARVYVLYCLSGQA
jgi:hypothetical protein